MVMQWFDDRLNMTAAHVQLRNAAQGSTSQFSQAPCLQRALLNRRSVCARRRRGAVAGRGLTR